ncbi:MAG: methyltransferase type 11 [Gammaproteobacteria bacterium]|nr:methyltransferase type 11 [Gammaproteobacteria bacterium]|tara:strand:- start:206 stop:787 length:582 start_codon:yes stop_codon:yes gene_type:complete
MPERFDKAYYDRFYRNPATRAMTPADARRQAAFVAAYLRHLRLPIRRIVDLGCGVGTTLRALGREFPGARLQGVERSDYLCGRYGWTPGTVEDYRDGRPYDLVVCHDVLGYLDDAACARAIGNIADLCRGAAYVSVITADDAGAYDADRTDAAQTLRPAAWYRRRLARHFLHVGGGLHLKKPVDTVVWALERA